jgi:hypothetical protein
VTLPANRVTLQTYSPYIAFDGIVIQYLLDGELQGQSNTIPYRHNLNLSANPDGRHTLTVKVLHNGKEIETVNYNLAKTGNNVVVSASQIAPPPTPAPAPGTLTVNPTDSTVFVNGTATAFEAYHIDGSNYFKLRDLASAVSGSNKQFEIGYDNATGAITMTSGQPYTPVGGEMTRGDGTAKQAALNNNINIAKDGTKVEVMAYLVDGNNFIKLRDVMRLFDIGVTWDGTTGTIGIDTSIPYTD